MTLLGFTGPVLSSAEAPEKSLAEPQVRFDEALACGNRLWIRGHVLDPAARVRIQSQGRWAFWRRKSAALAVPTAIDIETRIAGHVSSNTVPLGADGRFEFGLEMELPTARRGWRLARNSVTYQGRKLEKCCLAVSPPRDSQRALVVLLPFDCSLEAQGPQRLTRSERAAELTPVLQQLRRAEKDALYYVACVAPGSKIGQVELALATTTLGWPGGQFILLTGEHSTLGRRVVEGLDRLRWLFDGKLDVRLLNLEPGLIAPIRELKDSGGKARVTQTVNVGEDPRALLASGQNGAAALAPAYIRGAGPVPRLPVVFCHGMLAFSSIKMQVPENPNCFWHLGEFLYPRGYRVLFPKVAPTGGVAFRAGQLRDQILRWTDGPVNLIAHSMGGLDARYMITHLGMADHVRSLTTISTPHRGSYLVDWFLANYRQRVPLLLALEAAGFNVAGFQDCRPAACKEFNERTPDMPGVSYFSYGGDVPVRRVTAPLRRAWYLLSAVEGPNDGMVSLASARWGEYLGSVRADHFAQTPDLKFVRPNEDFDPLGFYFRILENLARRGF